MRKRIVVYVLGAVGAVALLALDGPIMGLVRPRVIGGDLRRELEALQQYGQLAALVITAILIWRLQPRRSWRLLDLALASGAAALACHGIKLLAGRARPMFDDPLAFVGPLGSFDPGNGRDPVTVWSSGYDLASMPSGHTAAAVVLSLFLALLYPRLRGFAILMASIVAVCRVLFGAHYPSDVLVGALVGLAIGEPIIRTYGGVRLLDLIWTRWIRPGADPALPEVLAGEVGRAA